LEEQELPFLQLVEGEKKLLGRGEGEELADRTAFLLSWERVALIQTRHQDG
jgi:hypothetical protein